MSRGMQRTGTVADVFGALLGQCSRRLDITEAWMVSVIDKLASDFSFCTTPLAGVFTKKCGQPVFGIYVGLLSRS